MSSPIQNIFQNDSKQLQASLNLESGSARIEVQCLLQAALQVNRAWLLAHQEHLPDDGQYARYKALFERRLHGEPVAYLLGEREFYGLNFKVTPATLIPRHDTELLVELALQRIPPPPPQPSPALPPIQLSPASGITSDLAAVVRSLVEWLVVSSRKSKRERQYSISGRGCKVRVLDMGTGSGAIALSIAHARPDAEVTAVDASAAALEIAQLNHRRLGLNNVRLMQSSWFDALHGERFDIIVSNPPYIASGDIHLSQGDVRFEPRSALASGADGLDDIRRIVAQAKKHLNANGWLLLEHGYDQAAQVRALLQQAGFSGIFSARDLAGIERVSGGT